MDQAIIRGIYTVLAILTKSFICFYLFNPRLIHLISWNHCSHFSPVPQPPSHKRPEVIRVKAADPQSSRQKICKLRRFPFRELNNGPGLWYRKPPQAGFEPRACVLQHWPLSSCTPPRAQDEWGERTHLVAMHIAILGMNQIWGVNHCGELDTVWFFTVFGL